MTVEQAIKKAMDAGYRGATNPYGSWFEKWLLDPLFWQAFDKKIAEEQFLRSGLKDGAYEPEWKETWHGLIEDLARGKSIKSFFEQF